MAPVSASYPHPVLGNGDDVSSVFEVLNASVTPTVEDLEVKFRLRVDDEGMRQLLQDGLAVLCASWTCAATLSSGELNPSVSHRHHDGATYEAWLDQRSVRERIRVDIQVVAALDISSYRPAKRHPDYGDQFFSIRAGDVLADGGWFEFYADKLYDPMRPPLGSCFRIARSDRNDKQIRVDFTNDDSVVIWISPAMSDGLRALGNLPELQLSLVVLPALLETLHLIQRVEADPNEEDLSDRAWYRTIKELAAPLAREQSQLVVAQRILMSPLSASLTTPLVPEEDD